MRKAALVVALLSSIIVARDADATSVGPFIFFFDSGSARVTPQAEGIVANFAGFLHSNSHISGVELHGHADRAGPPALNRRLSCRRAAAVHASLIGKGISADRMKTVGWGEEDTLMETADGVAEAMNRNVEVRFYANEDSQTDSKPHGPTC